MGKVQDVLTEHEAHVGGLQGRVAAVESEVDAINSDLTQAVVDIAAIQAEIADIKTDLGTMTSGGSFLYASQPSSTPTYTVASGAAIPFLTRTDYVRGSNISYDYSTGQITLQPGVYEVRYELMLGNFTNSFYVNLYNVTAAADVPGGYIVFYKNHTSANYSSGSNSLTVVIDAQVETILELRNRGIHGTETFNAYINASRLIVKEL